MALSDSVQQSLVEAEQSLRNALSFAARQEKPYVASSISDLICRIDSLLKTDEMLDKLDDMYGKKGKYFF
jgi:hypothetical protein